MEEYLDFLKDVGLSILFLPVAALISAAILKWLNTKIAKFAVPYSRAFRIELLIGIAYFCCFIILCVAGILFGHKGILNLIMLILIFLIGAPFYAKMIIHPEKGPIGWQKGIAYSLIFGALDIVMQISATIVPLFILSQIY